MYLKIYDEEVESKMKKLNIVIITTLLLSILGGCQESQEQSADSDIIITSEAEQTEENINPTEIVAEQTEKKGLFGSPADFRTNMEQNDFYVQEGRLGELDTIELASQGKLISCFGNNAGSVYTVFYLPSAPEQDYAVGNPELGWDDEQATEYDNPEVQNFPANPYFSPAGWQYKLRADEALVLFTELPPECKYYSFINYILFTEEKENKDYFKEKGYFRVGNEETGYYHPVFGSVGSSVNYENVKSTGDSPYGTNAVIVVSANKNVTDSVVNQLCEAGFSEDVINIMTIPENTYRMGLEQGKDTFAFLGRISQPADSEAYDKYISELSTKSTVYRVTPKTNIESSPYENQKLIPRGTGEHEAAVLDNVEQHLDEIRNAIIEQYADEYDYEELTSDIAVPEGLTAYTKDTNAQGDNRDTSYLMTQNFTLDSDEDFIVVYGVNHTATGKAKYSNAVLYARPMLNGVCSVYDSMFGGSAKNYLEKDCKDADSYYVYKMARTKMDENTKIIEYSDGNEKGKYYGADNGDTLLMAFRAYMDETGVGASYYEIVYDRAIVFHKK